MSDVNFPKKTRLTIVPSRTDRAKTAIRKTIESETHDPEDDEAEPVEPPGKANRSTGPITKEGKATSSRNAQTHGCTSSFRIVRGKLTPEALARIVLPDENPDDWEALQQNWETEYNPQNDLALDLVTRAAVADWMVRRNARRYNDVEQRLYAEQADATLWTAEQHAQLELFLRYQAKAERAFYRARTGLEQIRREKKRDAEKALQQHTPKPAKATNAELPSPGKEPDKELEQLLPKPSSSLIQCITVQVLEGKTFTLFHPRSENLERIIISAEDPKPTIKRALYFLHGIPDEYHWITEYESHDGRPHFVITRTSEQALDDLQRERLEGQGHVLRVK